MSEMIYTRHHVWLLPNEKQMGDEHEYTIGISQFAQEQLGDIVFVDLPEVGAPTQAGQACLVVESVKSASDVICPIRGKILAVNLALQDEPELINESPYEQGWIARIKGQPLDAIEGKMTQDEYNSYVSESGD